LSWSTGIFGTRNFFLTVKDPSDKVPTDLNNYLRLVDAFLFFPFSGEILLISEREADFIIEDMRKCMNNNGAANKVAEPVKAGAMLFHLYFIRAALDQKIPGMRTDLLVLGNGNPEDTFPPDDLLANLQLFAGETVFATNSRKAALKAIIRGNGNDESEHKTRASHEGSLMAEMRGLIHHYAHSDLKQVCDDVTREEEHSQKDGD